MLVGHVVPVPGGEFCDFCVSAGIVRMYRCHNFVMNVMPVFLEPEGRFAACAQCAETHRH